MENDYELYDCLGCATFRGASARVPEQTFEFNFSQSKSDLKSDNTTFNNKPNNKQINKQTNHENKV